MRFILLSCFFYLCFNPNFSLANSHTATPVYNQSNILNPTISAPILPAIHKPSPILPSKRAKKGLKSPKSRPNWDIWWLLGAVIGLGLYPISLALYLCGLGFGLGWLAWTGFGLLAILFLSLAFLFLTLKRNKSTADRFFEKYSLLLLWAGIFLAGLGTFIIALLLPVLWIWSLGLAAFIIAGLLLFLGWKKRNLY